MSTIILDLDKTLIHSIEVPCDDEKDECKFDKEEVCGTNGTLMQSGYITFKRPDADTFISWCFRKYANVVIWSAGTYDYVHEILNTLFAEFSFDLVLTRNECEENLRKNFNNSHITKLFKILKIDINNTNVYFVDDKLHRIQNECNVNLIEIQPFESKWMSIIVNKKKRKRPMRENDNSLLDIRKRLMTRT